MSDQNPFGAPPPPGPPQPYGPPQQGWGGVQPPPHTGPGYGVPQQPRGGGMVPPPPQQQSRRGLWIGLACVAGLVLAGAGVLGYFVYDAASKDNGGSTSTTSGGSTSGGTTSGGSTSGGTTAGGATKISLPSQFQGLDRHDDNPLAVKLKASMDSSLGTSGSTTPVSTVYTDGQKVVAVFGGYGEFIGPRAQVDSFFTEFEKGASSQGTTFSGRRDFPAGPRGGRLACEVMHAPTENDSLCVWADGYTLISTLTGEAGNSGTVDLDAAAASALELRTVAEVPK